MVTIITKFKKIIFFSFFSIVLNVVFADDDSVIVQSYESSDNIQQQSYTQQQISQEYDAKESYYNYCSLYSMYYYDDPMYGYGVPIWSSDGNECNYVNEVIEPSDSSSGNPTEDYPNIHQSGNGEVVFDQ